MDILKLQEDLDDICNDIGFITLLETHLTYLRTHGEGTVMAVLPRLNVKYEGDFYGLLGELGVDVKYHYITMRVNFLSNSGDYSGNLDQIVIPSITEIEILANIYLTKK